MIIMRKQNENVTCTIFSFHIHSTFSLLLLLRSRKLFGENVKVIKEQKKKKMRKENLSTFYFYFLFYFFILFFFKLGTTRNHKVNFRNCASLRCEKIVL